MLQDVDHDHAWHDHGFELALREHALSWLQGASTGIFELPLQQLPVLQPGTTKWAMPHRAA